MLIDFGLNNGEIAMLSKERRHKIVYLPYTVSTDKANEYTVNMIGILQEKYSVVANLAEPLDILQMLQTKAVFLNWTEQQLNHKIKLRLMLYKFWGAQIIWVFHNRYPHDMIQSDTILGNMKWLADHSSKIILHSQSSKKYIPNRKRNSRKAVYVPHVLYAPQNENADLKTIRSHYGLNSDDFVFTIFGAIRPYKNTEAAIAAFQRLHLKNARLLIAGNPIDRRYAEKIIGLCKSDKNIILDLKYISKVMLDGVIDISDVVVIPYHNRSSINSGVMIQSFSKGKPVITPDICMARDMVSEGFMYMYRRSLEKVMLKAYKNGKQGNRQMGIQAKEYMYKNNNRDVVKKHLYYILKK